ncbi:MAG: uroporphyrinogen-III C-methyltransferase [Firmicutes bacterium HGW-Firmicutes-1]|jgi:uroporphyrinogen III methyltransferase/synthase|nr:MAG: uroporphyrinogen-III C-methyltransferase [Firmicutes bacterium HGW-Firmicutes-1]
MVGKVYLVGAGPGDEKLMTLKGMEKITQADVIVYDELANNRLLSYAKEACETIYVGKKAGNHSLPQEKINELLVELAKQGKMIVRLKGGDPYVFGRGAEEGQVLKEEGVQFEVIPGITSAIGGLTYAGIPITHRGCASSFHVITGHLKSSDLELDFESLAKINGTLVFLMGVENLENICAKLMQYGKSPSTPAAIIYRASTPYQRVVVEQLDNLVVAAKTAQMEAPSLIVIGEVVNFRSQLSFFENKPLFGKRIVVTRARAQASSLATKIEDLGGLAITCPIIKTESVEAERLSIMINRLPVYTHILFTSVVGVELFFKALFFSKKDSRALGNIKITAIGMETSRSLLQYGIIADYMPESYVGEAIVDLLKDKLTPYDHILLPRSENARDYLVTELSKLCKVDEFITYRTIAEADRIIDLDEIVRQGKMDYVTFASSSTVDNFIELLGENYKEILQGVKLVSIGPITSGQIASYGLTVDFEAKQYTMDGIIEAIIEDKE